MSWWWVNICLCLQSTQRSRFVRQARAVAFTAVVRLEASGFWASVTDGVCYQRRPQRGRLVLAAGGSSGFRKTLLSSECLQKRHDEPGQCFHSRSPQPSDTFSRFPLSLIMTPLNTTCLPCLPPSLTSLTYCNPPTRGHCHRAPVLSGCFRFSSQIHVGTKNWRKTPSFYVPAANKGQWTISYIF